MNRQRLPSLPTTHQSGFSLVELAIVLIIVALLTSGLLVGLSSQRNLAENKDAQHQQEIIVDAILGFAMSSGRLPCPADPVLATANGAGREELQCTPADCSTGNRICRLEHGVIPWRSLGLQETDPWGNRFTYFVGREYANPFTQTEKDNGTRTRFTLDTVGRANIQDNSGLAVASDLPAVIVSHGSRGAGGYQSNGLQVAGASGDEAKNADANLIFVSHTPNDNFDDLVTWIIPSILKSRLVAVGKLP